MCTDMNERPRKETMWGCPQGYGDVLSVAEFQVKFFVKILTPFNHSSTSVNPNQIMGFQITEVIKMQPNNLCRYSAVRVSSNGQ